MRVLFLAGLMLLSATNFALAKELKIGVVDVRRIVGESAMAIDANDRIDKQFSERRRGLLRERDAIRRESEKIEREKLAMSADAHQKLIGALQQRVRELQVKDQRFQQELGSVRQSEFAKLQDRSSQVIGEFARENDYDLVLGDGVLFATRAVDITDKVLKRMDKK